VVPPRHPSTPRPEPSCVPGHQQPRGPIAAISLAASAWALEDRDDWIGWDREQPKARLQLVVANPRFLVPPWVPLGARRPPRFPPPRHRHRPPARRLAGPLRLPAAARCDLRRSRPPPRRLLPSRQLDPGRTKTAAASSPATTPTRCRSKTYTSTPWCTAFAASSPQH